MNAIVFWGEKGERSGVYYLLSPLCWTFFQVSLMIRWYWKLSLYMINLSLYCLDVCHALHDAHLVARIPRYSWIRVYNESKGDSSNFLENNNALSLYCSLKKASKLLTIHLSSKQETFWPLPLIPPRYYCIHSFWSQHTEKRNTTISHLLCSRCV